MSNYTGVSCPVCSKKFAESDDIVVCPQCGAPHHRQCYVAKNECAFVSEHMSGKEWQRPEEAPKENTVSSGTDQVCQNCGNANGAESIFCQGCGMRLNTPKATPQTDSGGSFNPGQNSSGQHYANFSSHLDPQVYIYGGISPETVIGGEKVKDIAMYVGRSSAYYLPRFQRLSQAKNSLSINLSAFFFNSFYYFYRKLYVVGAILLACLIACMFSYCLYIRELLPDLMRSPDFTNMLARTGIHVILPTNEVNLQMATFYQRLSNILWAVNVALAAFFSTITNSLYCKKVIESVQNIRKTLGDRMDPSRYNLELSYQGGVSMLAVTLAIGIFFLAYFFSASFTFSGVIL